MSDDAASGGSIWPRVKIQFSVDFGFERPWFFSEVSGLSSEAQIIIEEPLFPRRVRMPGLQRFGNVTLKEGMVANDRILWDLYNQTKMNVFKRRTIVISLLDEAGGSAMAWRLANAFPAKMTVTDMRSDAGETAIEAMEIAHEGMTPAAH
jgi:phage tail-like protein